jgi:hypothetical protein
MDNEDPLIDNLALLSNNILSINEYSQIIDKIYEQIERKDLKTIDVTIKVIALAKHSLHFTDLMKRYYKEKIYPVLKDGLRANYEDSQKFNYLESLFSICDLLSDNDQLIDQLTFHMKITCFYLLLTLKTIDMKSEKNIKFLTRILNNWFTKYTFKPYNYDMIERMRKRYKFISVLKKKRFQLGRMNNKSIGPVKIIKVEMKKKNVLPFNSNELNDNFFFG